MAGYFEYGGYQRVWRPVSIADTDRYSVSWSRRLEAQDMLDEMSFQHHKAAASCALGRPAKDSEVTVAPQRAPLHAQYPAFSGARACVGLSAIAQYNTHSQSSRKWLAAPTVEGSRPIANIDLQAAKLTQAYVVEAVSNRVCLDHLRLFEDMSAVESYRLFATAILDLRFPRLRDLILAACLMGDMVFALLSREQIKAKLHPLSSRILEAMAPALARYQAAILDCEAAQLPTHGAALAAQLMAVILPFLPPKPREEPAKPVPGKEALRGAKRVPIRKQQALPPSEETLSQPLQGMDEVVPPSIDEPNSVLQVRPKDGATQSDRLPAPNAMSAEQQQIQRILQHATTVVAQATGRETWHDPRVDQVVDAMRRRLFRPGVIEAELVARQRRVKAFGSEREGTLREEVLSRCRDRDVLARIQKGANPICKKLRHFRWFGERDDVLAERLQARGSIDPRRLPKIGSSDLIYRRWQKHSVTDYRGRPIVVLAKDGSNSNSVDSTFAGQILTAAFLRIERIARIQVIAADYCSGLAGSPLVRWLYHPQKTPGLIACRAVDAVASLPPKGQGRNEDVLSISHIMRETFGAVDNKQTIIVINIPDGRFNSPVAEFRKMIESLKADRDITYSLVILGNAKVDVPEADHTVHIPQSELSDPNQVAERIAKHVNALVLAQRRKGKKYRV